jgi:hypothetical protein
MDAFLHSCRARGWSVVANCMHADAAVIWSQLWAGRMRQNQQVWNYYRQQNKPVIVLEVGSIKRNHTWRVMLNGQHRPLAINNDATRANQFGIIAQPWQRNGNKILIALQRSDSNLWAGMPAIERWVSGVILTIQQYTDREIIVRQHPRQSISLNASMQVPVHIPGTYDEYDFTNALHDVYVVINHNSSSAVQSILNGVPAVVSASSIAAAISQTDVSKIDQLIYADRQQWINDLAWSEWTVDEIAHGLPLQLLNIS